MYYTEAAEKIREQKPSLSNMYDDDKVLVEAFIKARPEYAEKITFEMPGMEASMQQTTPQRYGFLEKLTGQRRGTPTALPGMPQEKEPLYQYPGTPLGKKRTIDKFLPSGFKTLTSPRVAGQVGQEAINAALLNMPKAILGKLGWSLPAAETGTEKLASIGGTVAGALAPVGPAGQVARAPGRIKAFTKLPGVVKGAIGGALEGLAWTPETKESDLVAIDKRLGQAGIGGLIGAALGGISSAWDNLGKVKNLKTDEGQVKLSKIIGKNLFKAKREAGKKFETALNTLADKYPKTMVKTTDIVDNLAEVIDDNRILRSLMRKSPLLEDLATSPRDITIKEAQKLSNELNALMPKKFVEGDVGFLQLEAKDLIDNIRLAQLEAFPELAPVRADYKKFMDNFNLLVKKVKDPDMLLNVIANEWSGPAKRIAAKKILKPSLQKPIKNYQKIKQAEKFGKKIKENAVIGVTGGAAAGAAVTGLSKLLGLGGRRR